MARLSRSKGARLERELVRRHHEAGLPAEKLSRTGYTGPDLRIADEWTAEVKGRRSGEGFKQLATWLGEADLLFLRRDRQAPLVLMPWRVYEEVLRGYLSTGRVEEVLRGFLAARGVEGPHDCTGRAAQVSSGGGADAAPAALESVGSAAGRTPR